MARKHTRQMHALLVVVCEAIGLSPESVSCEGARIEVAETGLSVELIESDGHKRWHVQETYQVATLRSDDFREAVDTVLVASVGEEAHVAKVAGMTIAGRLVESAIDLAVG